MPSATRTEVFDVGIDAFFEAILDYKAYPEFVDHMENVRLLKQEEGYTRAKFFLNYMKEVNYTLDLYHESPHRLWWTFVRGDIFTQMDGSWTLKRKAKRKTEVIYEVSVEAKIKAPDFIVKRLVAHNLPHMMHSFYERALLLEG